MRLLTFLLIFSFASEKNYIHPKPPQPKEVSSLKPNSGDTSQVVFKKPLFFYGGRVPKPVFKKGEEADYGQWLWQHKVRMFSR